MMLLALQQKNETYSALEQTYDIIADGFNDTYMATKRPTVSLTYTFDLALSMVTYEIWTQNVNQIIKFKSCSGIDNNMKMKIKLLRNKF